MDMKAKSSLIRKHRQERMWSQEQLAEISSLSLRTIQRIEGRGSASMESIKALAAVFELEAENLVWKDGCFQIYRHKQWSWVTFTVMPLIAAAILAAQASLNAIPSAGLGVIFGLLTLVTVIFSSMTIEVNESEILWFFGPGAFLKKLPLEEVGTYTAVKNPLWMGFGIHAYGTGWIYNVSGLLGVNIELKGGSFIRLGSNEPNYLIAAIEDAKANAA
jgi:DNA-binding XRE family transcriptional regulator